MTIPKTQLLETLHTALTRLHAAEHTIEQVRTAVATSVHALTEMERLLRPDHIDAGRNVNNLTMAVIRAGMTLRQISHLTCIPAERLDQLATGAHPTGSERRALEGILTDWNGRSRP